MHLVYHNLRRRLLKYTWFLKFLAFLLLVSTAIFLVFKIVPLLLKFPVQLVNFLKPPQSVLRTTSGRTNFILLGMGGAGHEAPDLTDTIIFASLNPQTQDIVLISIPRDLWIPSLRAKINTTYYYGEQKQLGGGLILTKASIEEVLGQPVHYGLAINFTGFTRAIDLVGGIDITIPQTFDDFKYPIPGQEAAIPEANRYEHVHFDAGPQHLDGATALKYVRSRNAEGDQGTDFARQARQQQVLTAFKDKLFSTQTLLNPNRLLDLKQTFSAALIHDLSDAEILALVKTAFFNPPNLRSGILDTATSSGLLTHPPVSARYDYQWTLIPQDDHQLKDYVRQLLFGQ
ncbi:MAG: LCP family protein [Candidatus Chisholmbacteria bacterium]|nr:LCP family protein [Candidatus Chisholmbacteria bacterium]